MKKELFLLLFVITAFETYAQTAGDGRFGRGMFNQSIYLRDRWIDTLRNDTAFQGAVRSLPTADAVYRFVNGRIIEAASPGGSTYQLQYNNGSFAGAAIYTDGNNLGIGVTPTAQVDLKASIGVAGTGPLKFRAGPLLSSAEAGLVEYYSDKLYFTINTATARKEITLNDAALTSGRIPFVAISGRLTDNSNLKWNSSLETVMLPNIPNSDEDKFLTTDADGNVVLATVPAGGAGGGGGSSKIANIDL